MKLLALFLSLSLLTACSSTTIVRSTDPEARIYIDGEFKGNGSIIHSDSKISGSTTHVRLEKDGCPPMTYSFKRNERVDVGACVAGVLLVPLLWWKEYQPEREFVYHCTPTGKASR